MVPDTYIISDFCNGSRMPFAGERRPKQYEIGADWTQINLNVFAERL